MIYDGHGSHLTYYTARQAMDNGIILLCLPPNTSHALQPLDVGVFAPLKKIWKDVLKTWYRESRQRNVSKATFPFLLKRLSNFLKPVNAVKGFVGCGLFPVNKEKVKHKILLTEKGTSDNATQAARTSLEEDCPSTSLEQNCPSISLEQNRPSTSVEQTGPSTSQGHTDLSPSQAHEDPATSQDWDNSATSQNDAHPANRFSSLGLVTSPFKDLKVAILSTLSPPQSSLTTLALQNLKKNRKRVQSKVDEVLTEETVGQQLL